MPGGAIRTCRDGKEKSKRKRGAMADALDDEHAELIAEHAELEAEHKRLEKRPKDIDAHRAHAERLHAHVGRLHDYMARRGFQVLRKHKRPRPR
jgi:ubiquinone biosynthesis protein UbiJ